MRAARYVVLAGAKHTMSACHTLTGTYMGEQIRPSFVRNPRLKANDTIPR